MLKRYIQHIRSLILQPSRWKGGVIGMMLLLAAISQAQITTGYIVKGGPDTGPFSGGVLIGTTSKINYALTEQRILIDEKPGILEGSWKDVTGVNQSTTSLTKTAADGWGNAGAASNNILDTLQNGWIQYKINSLSDVFAFGLSANNLDAHYNSIDYAVMINAGQLQVYNQGLLVGNYGTVAVNDSIRIARIGNILFFTKNKEIFYNREVDAKQPIMSDVALYSQGMVFEIKSSFAEPCNGNFTINVNSVTITSGQTAILMANGANAYSWSTGETTNSISVSPTTTTSYTVTGVNSGCSATAIATVLVDADTASEEENEPPDLDDLMSEPDANFYEIKEKFESYYALHPDTDGGDNERAEFSRWVWFWQGRVDKAQTGIKSGSFVFANQALASYLQAPICTSPGNSLSAWTPLGPLTQPNSTAKQNMGIINSLYVDPTNNNNIFAGSNSGGLFKTTDGGATWTNPDVSHLPGMGIQCIVVDPSSNNQKIYIATGLKVMGRAGYGLGVLKSTDGGAHWVQTSLTINPNSLYTDFNIYKIIMEPNTPTIMYAVGNHNIYRTNDGFSDPNPVHLVDITPNITASYRDIRLQPDNPNIVYTSGNELWLSINKGNTWSRLDNLSSFGTTPAAPSGFPNFVSRSDIDICPITNLSLSINGLYALVGYTFKNNTPGSNICNFKTIWQIKFYDLSANAWTNSVTTNSAVQPRSGNFVVNSLNPLIIYSEESARCGVIGRTVVKSTDGGLTFLTKSNYNSLYNGTYTHCDIRAIDLTPAGTPGNDVLVVGNDGGILKSTNGGTSWSNINGTGLNVTQFFGIGGTESNAKLVVGGAQDNGLYTYNAPNWSLQDPLTIGDAYDAAIDKFSTNIMFGTANGGANSLKKSINGGGQTWATLTQPPGVAKTNRPIFIDKNNNWYAGYHDVFISTNQGGSWTNGVEGRQLSNFDQFNTSILITPTNGDPPYTYNSVVGQTISAIAVAPSNSNYIYAAFGNPTWDINPNTGLGCGANCSAAQAKKIFMTKNASSPTPTWIDITAGLSAVNYAEITGIAVDPNNPLKIWVTFSNIWAASPGVGVNRVIFGLVNELSGTVTWEDFSTGLPEFPVNCIVYHKGAASFANVLYVGTDVGVFYRQINHPIQQWICFNSGLPIGIVPDLEINHCAGKIRASVYGRGVWESPLPSPPSIPEITTSVISSPVSYTSDIKIPSGSIVTVTSTITMAENRKIIIERGGTLIVNGGTITNGCGLMWQGIEVQGNRNASQQTAGAQGKVILKNNALIENAREGITTIKTNTNGSLDWNYTGGIVQAQNTIFRNCRRDAQFLSYRNFHPVTGITLNNISYFRNCVFETTQQLNDPAVNLDAHVTLYDVKGIQFLGNDFSNTAPAGANLGVIQNGITSVDAAYTVADFCLSGNTQPCNTVKRSSFKNLKYGIYATNSNPLMKVTVNHAIFVNNRYDGIYLKGMNYPVVINSSFDVGSYTQLSSGLYLDNCKYYSVQNNQFFTTSTGGGSVGIWANNSKAGAHEIYNNTFTGLSGGIVPLNDNSGMTNTTDGLRINCNTFTGNGYDIGITGSTANNNSIALVQGSTPGTSKDLVRNRYSAPCGNENQFFITGSTKPVIHASHTNANTQPLPQPSCSDALVQVSPTSYQWQASDCPDKTLFTNQQLITQINQLAIAAQALRNNYNAMVDGGNTQQLITAVNSNISAGSLKNTLMNKSPYLSDPVMVAYLTRSSTPPPGHIKDIITTNSPVTTAVKIKVDALNLPNGIQQQINNAQTGVSARLKLEAQITQTEFNAQLYTADLINSFLNDTLIPNPIDSVINVLNVFPRPDASKELIQAYIAKGDYTSALSLINPQPVSDFGELQKLIIQVNQASDKAYSLQTNTTLKTSLEAFANDCNREGCVYAQALLNLVFNTSYPELRILPQGLREMQADMASEQTNALESGLLIYPNPANDEVNIIFNDTTAATAIVEIHDLLGKLIERVSLKSGVTFSYNAAFLPKSIYMVSLYIDGELIENKKMVLIR